MAVKKALGSIWLGAFVGFLVTLAFAFFLPGIVSAICELIDGAISH